MELKTFVTYMGLLFTAYNLNPEYKKFQIKLSSIIWKFIFVITLILLFLSSNELFRKFLIYQIHIKNYIAEWIWVSKYHLLVLLNMISVYMIFNFTKLNKYNHKEFFELVKNLETEKKDDLKSKLIKDNLDRIFNLKNYKTFKNRLYNFILPIDKLQKKLLRISELQIKNFQINKNFDSFNESEDFRNIEDTKIEKVRKKIANFIKPKSFQNYFEEIYRFLLDEKFIKYIIKNDEQLGLNILEKISEYKYFTESYEFGEFFLKQTLSNSNSLSFKYLFDNNQNVNFIIDNQGYENGFDLGLIICETIENLVRQNKKALQNLYLEYSENKVYKHISNLYEILRRLEVNKIHLSNNPYYLQQDLINLVDFSLDENKQNLAFHLILRQLDCIEYLASKTTENVIIQNMNDLIGALFRVTINKNESLLLKFALYYYEYVFKYPSKIPIKRKIRNFINFIENSDKKVTLLYLKVFENNKYLRKLYSHYKLSDEYKKEWRELFEYLKKNI